METFLALCRPGFESDLAAEFTERAADLGVAGYPRADKNKGYVLWHRHAADGFRAGVRAQPLSVSGSF
jgi:23S rRNA (cytidine2498-2'-O)-methyltransferase